MNSLRNLPMTSAELVDEINHASSPNRPSLYLLPRISLGNPQATDTKCGFTFWLGSINVANPEHNARVTALVVHASDCIFMCVCVCWPIFSPFRFKLFVFVSIRSFFVRAGRSLFLFYRWGWMLPIGWWNPWKLRYKLCAPSIHSADSVIGSIRDTDGNQVSSVKLF